MTIIITNERIIPEYPDCFGMVCMNNGMLQVQSCKCKCSAEFSGIYCEYGKCISDFIIYPIFRIITYKTLFSKLCFNLYSRPKLTVLLIK